MKFLNLLATALLLVCASAFGAEEAAVISGMGKVKFDAVLQTWIYNESNPAASTPTTNFLLRRTEIKFSGSLLENTRWFTLFDVTKGANALQDVGVAFKPTSQLEFIAGQFKTLTTAEGLDSASQLFFPERAMASRAFGDVREPGVMATYEMESWKLGAMLSNGRGTNTGDANAKKDLAVRLEGKIADELKVGAFTQASDFSYVQKSRFGFNAGMKTSNFLVRGEIDFGHDTVSASPVDTHGWYADAGYDFTDHWMPILRVEQYHVKDIGTGTVITPCINYFLSSHNSKIQAAWSFATDLKTSNGAVATPAKTTSDIAPETHGSVFTINFQAAI